MRGRARRGGGHRRTRPVASIVEGPEPAEPSHSVREAMALTDEQRRHLERRLQEERQRALRVIRTYDESGSNPTGDGDITNYPFHMADQGTDSFDQEMSTKLAERAT